MKTEARQRRGWSSWLWQVDRILRGEATRLEEIRNREIQFPILGVCVVLVLLGSIYGLCMAVYAMIHGAETGSLTRASWQTMASMVKVPLLFALTLVVTFPSLYVFNALVGSRLVVLAVLKLLVASLVVNLAVLASMGPILAFFSASTPNYPFIVVLNVAIFSVAGALGLTFLVQTLNRLSTAGLDGPGVPNARPAAPAETGEIVLAEVRNVASPAQASALDSMPGVKLGRHVKTVFLIWILLFGCVGAQMGWLLRPFIGAPNKEFSWFRERESNFYEAVFNAVWNLFG